MFFPIFFYPTVVVGEYEVQVYDQLVILGNTAILRCAVPAYVKDYVTVTSWVHDQVFSIYPSLHGGKSNIFIFLL